MNFRESVPAMETFAGIPTPQAELTILLHAAEPAATAAAEALRKRLSAAVEVATTLGDCKQALGKRGFSVLLLEESLSTVASEKVEVLFRSAGPALVMEINFALVSADRVVRQVQAALRRQVHDQQLARVAAREALRQDVNAALTGLLLEAQLALRHVEPGLVPALERLVNLAEHLCSQLQH